MNTFGWENYVPRRTFYVDENSAVGTSCAHNLLLTNVLFTYDIWHKYSINVPFLFPKDRQMYNELVYE